MASGQALLKATVPGDGDCLLYDEDTGAMKPEFVVGVARTIHKRNTIRQHGCDEQRGEDPAAAQRARRCLWGSDRTSPSSNKPTQYSQAATTTA